MFIVLTKYTHIGIHIHTHSVSVCRLYMMALLLLVERATPSKLNSRLIARSHRRRRRLKSYPGFLFNVGCEFVASCCCCSSIGGMASICCSHSQSREREREGGGNAR